MSGEKKTFSARMKDHPWVPIFGLVATLCAVIASIGEFFDTQLGQNVLRFWDDQPQAAASPNAIGNQVTDQEFSAPNLSTPDRNVAVEVTVTPNSGLSAIGSRIERRVEKALPATLADSAMGTGVIDLKAITFRGATRVAELEWSVEDGHQAGRCNSMVIHFASEDELASQIVEQFADDWNAALQRGESICG